MTNWRRMMLYLAAWIPVGGLLLYWMTTITGLKPLMAAGPVLLLVALYAFACLSSFYTCKALPLNRTRTPTLMLTHLITASVISVLWLHLFDYIGYMISPRAIYNAISNHIDQLKWLLWVTGTMLYLLSVTLHYMLLALDASRVAEQRAMEAQLLARDAELRALKAQINPHFLFNSLNSISALTSLDHAKARRMCVTLAEFLRQTLRLGERLSIPLSEELALIDSYLSVEKIRFGERLTFTKAIDEEALSCQVPPLLLQPLVENAVGHGIADLQAGGYIELRASYNTESQRTSVVITNNFDPEAPAQRRNGVGLTNVGRRLQTRFGSQATIKVEKLETVFRVTLEFPAIREQAS